MEESVTILILIDGFLQYQNLSSHKHLQHRHNPYFNRWFSAIKTPFLGSFPRVCHNPYFNRWFSAIIGVELSNTVVKKSQSLF